MHTLDSVMMSLDAFDTVTVTERDDTKVCVRFTNADVDPVNNTAYAAARLVEKVGHGADITIDKGIPIGAGLGGSSADGAAVLRAYDLFYNLPKCGVNMRKTALSVGSDVPFMLTGGLARVGASGEDMFFIENKLELFAIGLMDELVSTAGSYKKFDELYADGVYCPTDNDKLCELLLSADKRAVEHFGNGLTEPSIALAPSIDKNIMLLREQGATACMTGSGGMTLGWFTDIEAFARAASKLKGCSGFRALAPVKTGILHEWIQR